jgi:hypothetical protein
VTLPTAAREATADFLGMTKKQYVAEPVAFHTEHRRAEIEKARERRWHRWQPLGRSAAAERADRILLGE